MPHDDVPDTSRDSLYTILNLPVSCSQDDIRHRFKELAVIFHPDKQSHKDENAVRVAGKRFREIQRAYEILTDPDQRYIYDTLGEAGLSAQRAIGHRYSSPDQLRLELERLLGEAKASSRYRRYIKSRGALVCAFDAADAFAPGHEPGLAGLITRGQAIHAGMLSVKNTMEVNVNNIEASLSGRISASPYPRAPRDYGNIVGTIRHQFSPRIQFEATANLLRSHAVTLMASYGDEETQMYIRAMLSTRSPLLLPPLALELERKLFATRLTRGTLHFQTGPRSTFSAGLLSPLGSQGLVAWSAGLHLAQLPALSAEVITGILLGGFKAKFGAELGLTGLTGVVTGQWVGPEDSLVSVGVHAGGDTIFMKISLDCLGQHIEIPIILSHELDVLIGLGALLLPSGLAVLVHNFVIKPRLRARHRSQLEAARQAYHNSIKRHEEEARETTVLLSEGAQRGAEHERAIDGLVILWAAYLASGDDYGDLPVAVDVTVPLQAQVHNSQLTIPGGRSKAGLLGFYDPSPGARKHLKIEYLFRGCLHVADVGDFSHVILPLRAHLIE